MSITAALASLAAAAAIDRPPSAVTGGRAVAYDGLTINAAGVDLAVGTICAVGPDAVAAEVIGFRDKRSVLMGLAALGPLLPGGAVMPLRGEAPASVGPGLLGRVVDGGGRTLDGGPQLPRMAKVPLEPSVANPLTRTTARILGARAGAALKRMVMELGGFNPMLILGDADLGEAVRAVIFGAFIHQGQVCMNTRKVYVARDIHDEFVDPPAARTRALKAGAPVDPSVIIGPLINARAVDATMASIKDAVDRGATLVTGGTADGAIVAPTILTHASDDALCTTGRDETFGPLLVIEAVDDAEAALAKTQDTPYGLSAAIFTRDHARGLAMAQRFDTGIVHINAPTMASEASLPVGGVKDSGWGRSGLYWIEDYTELRLTIMSTVPGIYPF
jgi:hypothetical protein